MRTTPSDTTLVNSVLTIHISIGIDHHRAFSINPPKQGKILPFVRSLKYCKVYLLQTNFVIL